MNDKPANPALSNLLDVRPAAQFEAAHRAGAVNIPLEELPARIHELPPPYEQLIIFDSDPRRAEAAMNDLKARERSACSIVTGEAWLHSGPIATGPAMTRLWRPHALTIRLAEVARSAFGTLAGRRALDIASGTGRDAVYLAMQGLTVEAWDNLPDALQRLDSLARRNGVSVATNLRDVEADPQIPADSFDLVCCFNFLHRPLMPRIAAAVRPGGFVAYETFCGPQRELFGKPARESHVLRTGELLTWFQEFEMHHYTEGLLSPRRYAASLIARRLR